jgi:hypothetical protein
MALKIIAGEGARDPDGFDREALHEATNREIIGFFNHTLRPADAPPAKSAQPASCRSRESRAEKQSWRPVCSVEGRNHLFRETEPGFGQPPEHTRGFLATWPAFARHGRSTWS